MPKKDTDDPIIFAESVLDQIISKHDPEVAREEGKNPAAVALGKRGGSKGGSGPKTPRDFQETNSKEPEHSDHGRRRTPCCCPND